MADSTPATFDGQPLDLDTEPSPAEQAGADRIADKVEARRTSSYASVNHRPMAGEVRVTASEPGQG
jgi:hypothetical protein